MLSRVIPPLGQYAFPQEEDVEVRTEFMEAVTLLLEHQYVSFNSPFWFNMGISEKPQVSACFINSVEDTMESILQLVRVEGMIFKNGSGSGVNISKLRAAGEPLSHGGTASGPIHFMRGLDSMAGAIKSGGATRRAAKMVIMDLDHPDIEEFIQVKVVEETKALALMEAGFSRSLGQDGDDLHSAYISTGFQNANHSVCIPDAFMRMLDDPTATWETRARLNPNVTSKIHPKELFEKIAKAAHACGDPGVMFYDNVNAYNTVAADGPIRASNPCAEFLFLDNSACNLASINLLKFYNAETEKFDWDLFECVVEIMIVAQDALVDHASYPTKKIASNSKAYRPLGLGYTNLGALLMTAGIAYGSPDSLLFVRQITAVMTARAYITSALLAQSKGPFPRYEANARDVDRVLCKHCDSAEATGTLITPLPGTPSPSLLFKKALELSKKYGLRNAQVTLLAPTGTISFMMDCESTGIEPVVSHTVYKQLVGGGNLTMVAKCAEAYLAKRRLSPSILNNLPESLNELDEDDQNVLRTAIGALTVTPDDHLNVLAAAQEFLSGGVSKTVNLPSHATVDDLKSLYQKAWKLGIKCLSLYRDGSKGAQPLTTTKVKEQAPVSVEPYRKRMPPERNALVHKFNIGGHEGYLTVGLYEDKSPGEIFIVMSKVGTVVSGMADAFATMVSIGLQYGVPIEVIIDKFSYSRFEPSGFTPNPKIPHAKSIVDYIARYLNLKFGAGESVQEEMKEALTVVDDEACPRCGALMVRAGTCHFCPQCGDSSGCS